MIDGGLHAAELRRLDVEHLQDIVGQRVDQIGDTGQRLGGVVLGLLQRPLLVWRLDERKVAAISGLTERIIDELLVPAELCQFSVTRL